MLLVGIWKGWTNSARSPNATPNATASTSSTEHIHALNDALPE